MHLRAQIACYQLKGDLSPVLSKKIFHDSFENFEIKRTCMENRSRSRGRVQGVRTPPPPQDDLQLFNTTGLLY